MRVTLSVEILITMLALFTTPTKQHRAAEASRVRRSTDILCNIETRFECVCHVEDGNLLTPDGHVRCYNFISGTVPALRLTLSHFGSLDALSPETKVTLQDGTPVTYEYYFRYYVAQILNRYCLETANRCQNVGLVFKPENVVIIEISAGEENRITVDYALTRSFDVADLSPDTVAAPEIVLAGVAQDLQTFLPYPIFSHVPYVIVAPGSGRSAWQENVGLITALIIFACVLVFIYIVAIIKAVRDRANKSSRPNTSATRKDSNVAVAAARSTQYGSTDHRSQPLRPSDGEEYSVFDSAKPIAIMVPDTLEPSETDELLRRNGRLSQKTGNQSSKWLPALPFVSKKMTASKSLQLSSPSENAEKKLKLPKKAATCYFTLQSQTYDQEMVRANLVTVNSDTTNHRKPETRTGTRDVVAEIANGDWSRADANTVQIPVLIIPAMSKPRDDLDYVAKTRVEPGSADAEPFRYEYQDSNAQADIQEALSEEYLLSVDMKESGSVFGLESSGSSASLTSRDDHRSPSPVAFDVGYQPLRDSGWSVNKLVSDEHDLTDE